MTTNLPTVQKYLEQLPLGIDSHPECQAKASVLRNALASRSLVDVLDALPAPVRELVVDPPPVSTWVREVHALVAMLAIRDVHFPLGAHGLAEYEAWTHRRNRELLTRPLYRALFLVLSPDRLIDGMQKRWGHFRRGTSIELLERERGRAKVRIRFPTRLYEETVLAGLRGALRAALEAAGAHEIEIETEHAGVRDARYSLAWR